MARTKSSKLKGNKKYTDAPRFRVTYGYEDAFKKKASMMINAMVKDIITKANAMVLKK